MCPGVEMSGAEMSENPLCSVQCTPHTAVRPGTNEDTSPLPLSLSMTTSTTNLVASNHRAGKCDFQAHSAVERQEWSETRVDWGGQGHFWIMLKKEDILGVDVFP